MSDPSEEPSMKVVIKEVTGVATWNWIANDDTCSICRFPFIACCPICTYPGDRCRLVSSHCNHYFHMHCLVKWFEVPHGKYQCPLCRQQWKK